MPHALAYQTEAVATWASVTDTKWYKGQEWTPCFTLKKAVVACLTLTTNLGMLSSRCFEGHVWFKFIN